MKIKTTKTKCRPRQKARKTFGDYVVRMVPEPTARRLSIAISRKRILVVEDDRVSREFYSALLSEAGYQVDQAAHALAALFAVVRAAPDLILADIGMPIVDGIELVRELKSHRDTHHIPVVAVTGYDTPEVQESALQAGYSDYITKPINPRRFPTQVAKLILQHGSKRQAQASTT